MGANQQKGGDVGGKDAEVKEHEPIHQHACRGKGAVDIQNLEAGIAGGAYHDLTAHLHAAYQRLEGEHEQQHPNGAQPHHPLEAAKVQRQRQAQNAHHLALAPVHHALQTKGAGRARKHNAIQDDAAAHQQVALLVTQGMVIVCHQQGLRRDEGQQRHNEVALSEQKVISGKAEPNGVCRQHDAGMARNLGIVILHQPANGRAKIPAQVLDQVFDIVVHPSQSMVRQPRTPHQAVQERLQKSRRTLTKTLDDVGMSGEKLIAAVVIHVAICTNCQQVLEHGLGAVQAPRVNGPEEGRE
mmetsp:Transcript_63621/g.152072  ORF Transcript_63621/g.152072 Transcript_63621/m.152072 type:complete len:298 (-) Transcript_63621:23-916(-)